MRPVTPNNQSYQIPPTMTTRTVAIRNGLAANGVQPVGGVTVFNTTQVLMLLDTLTWQNQGAAGWANLNQVNQGLVVSLINYFSTNDTMKYGNARGALIDNYGQYCGYCGTQVQDSALAIEHCMPKSEFPGKMLNYDNFFLCCPSCNSYKGAQPNYVTARAWALQHPILNPNPNLPQIVNGGFGRQLWPNNPQAWSGFPPQLNNLATNQQIAAQNSTNLTNAEARVTQNIVWATISGFPNPIPVAAAIATSAGNDQVLQARENNFIAIVQLNTWQQGVYSDRRVTNRTLAWLNVLASLRNLNAFNPVGSQLWFIALGQIFATAKAAGFFEIWAWLFYYISPPATGQNSVYLLFRATSTNANQPLYYFPGTNINDLPAQ